MSCRPAAKSPGNPHILVIGSHAVLGTFDEDDLAAPATASREADIAFLNDPGGQKADMVDAAIGELSPFYEQFGYYAQGVEVSTAMMPAGWADRLTTWHSRPRGTLEPSSSSHVTWPWPNWRPSATRTAPS